MKAFKIHPASCSCTGCVYQSRSKDPNVRKIIQGGTEIDKLYYGKYIPLRERKLLEKLIKTRDVYDDVRNQLLSTSESSDQASLEYKKKRRRISCEKSSAILKIVNLVDRGQIGSGSKLSSCCSYGSCETLRKIRKRMSREEQKHPRVHRHIVTCEDIAKYCAEATERGKKRRRKLSTKISSKICSKVGAARLKIKKNLSEPCTCPISLSSMETRPSNTYMEKIRSKKKATETGHTRKAVTIDHKAKVHKVSRRSHRSIQSSSTKDSGTEFSPLAFKIKKDSVILFKEKLLKKRSYEENKDVECEPGTCDTDDCIPEECFENVKVKGVGDTRKRKHHSRHSETGREKSYISIKPRTKKPKKRDLEVQDYPSETNSSYSMTTILKTKEMPSYSKSEIKGKARKSKAKSQLAAKDKELEEKVPAHGSPKSHLGNINCECKPATKSTSSLTSVPKQKASKSRSKHIKTSSRETDNDLPPTRHKKSRQKPRRERYQSLEETDLKEPVGEANKISSSSISEHIKGKREKRKKAAHGRIKQRRKHQHSKTQFSSAVSRASQESYLRESASQATEFYRGTVLPSRRECEPLMCIPYECDPERCAKILKPRSKSRGRSAKTSMDRLKRKSVGSAISQKTSSKSRSKHDQSKSAENVKRKSKYVSKEPPPQIVERNKDGESRDTDRQAVKISSSFSFDIEFYKDAVNRQEELLGHQKSIKQKKDRTKYKDRGTISPDMTKQISSQHITQSMSTSSQSLQNYQIGHRLKRCLCTLKILQKKNKKIRHVASKKTMATLHNKELENQLRIKRTQTKLSGMCECPEIRKQLNQRAARHVSKETNTAVSPRKSKVASTSQSVSKSTSRRIQSIEHRNLKQKRKHSQSSKIDSLISSDKSERQAVRIGSNFNFNIEFSKTNNYDRDTGNTLVYGKPIKKETRHLQQKGIKVYKPRLRHEASETNTYVKTKQTYTEPFLQRCLCTLKLLKKNKKKVEQRSPWHRDEYTVMHMKNQSIKRNREIRNNYERSKHIPYNCEPEFCIPKEGDPYNCNKILKSHQMKLQYKYSNIDVLGSRSTRRTPKTTHSIKSRNTQSFTRESQQRPKKLGKDHSETNISPVHSKNRVPRVGPNLILKSKLSKEISSPYCNKDSFNTTGDLFNKQNKDKFDTIGSQQFQCCTHDETIDGEAKQKEKGGSYVMTAIKTCISNFKFQKKNNKTGGEDKINLISSTVKTISPMLSSQICEYKNTCSRLGKQPFNLDSHEGNECFKESMQQGIKELHDQYISTDKRRRKSVISFTRSDFSGNTKAKSAHYRSLNHITKEDEKVMKVARSFSPSHQAARFNTEILINRFMPSIRDIVKDRKEKFTPGSEISAVKGIKSKQIVPKDCLSQAYQIKKENKASHMGLFLKKCLSTLGLQKKNIPKREFHCHQPVTTEFVKVVQNCKEMNRHNVTKSGRNIPNKNFFRESKSSEDGNLFRENLIGNKNSITKPHYDGSQNLPNSYSFSKRPHMRSGIDLSFDKMRHLLNTHKINPFYRSFYALNVRVSNPQTISQGVYRTLNDKKRKPCKPNECDPADCSQIIKELKTYTKRDYVTETDCYKKCKAKFLKESEAMKKPRVFGSDLRIKMGVYKDTDLYKDKHRQALRVGTDAGVSFDFFKEPKRRGNKNLKKERRRKYPPPDDHRQGFYETQSEYSGISQRFSPKCGRKAGRKKYPRLEFCATPNTASVILQKFSPGRCRKAVPKRCPQPDDRQEFCETPRREVCATQNRASEILRKFAPCRGRNAGRKRYPRPEFCSKASGTSQKISPGHCRKAVRKRCPRPDDRQEFCETQREASEMSQMFQKCSNFCAAKLKKATKSDICQNADIARTCRGNVRSTPRLSKKKCCKSKATDRNNVTFCNNVNCVEYFDALVQKQKPKLNSIQGRGDGDIETKCCKGPVEKKNTIECRCKSEKEKEEKKKKNLIARCLCPITELKKKKCCCCSKGRKKLTSKESLETISRKDKKCKYIAEAEREMETIMPYSKKKFRNVDSQLKLDHAKDIKAKGLRKLGQVLKIKTHDCMCYKDPHGDLCPMCKPIKKGDPVLPTCPCCKKRFILKSSPPIPPVHNTPLFEMTVNKANMKIVNKDEVLRNMIAANQAIVKKHAQHDLLMAKTHGPKCRCCICRKIKCKRKAATLKARKINPCVCGSTVCKKERDQLELEQKSRAGVKIKTCVCGSPICEDESSKLPEILLAEARQVEHDKAMAKIAKKKEKRYRKAYNKRKKMYKTEFINTVRHRKKLDKREMKIIKRNEDSGNLFMIAESLTDLGRFGSKAFCDISRILCRRIRHPRDGIYDIKDAIHRPDKAAKKIKETVEGTGIVSTFARIKARFKKMPTTKSAVTTLESYPVTNYMLHVVDKDPRKRLKKFKTKNKREPLDYECSLYMASMRKRPCLRIYYMCPWFYPHCMSLLQGWKHVVDVLLFILAVVVWCPCILCMELCRGFVCCGLCQV